MIYLDTAALVKLVRHEAESAALVEVEVSRALLRSDPPW